MVQVFHVLQCCECKVFQVHQVKKSNKWHCKMCGMKQSIRQVYGKGSGIECRHHVQKLNLLLGQKNCSFATNQESSPSFGKAHCDFSEVQVQSKCYESSSKATNPSNGNKWIKFCENEICKNEKNCDIGISDTTVSAEKLLLCGRKENEVSSGVDWMTLNSEQLDLKETNQGSINPSSITENDKITSSDTIASTLLKKKEYDLINTSNSTKNIRNRTRLQSTDKIISSFSKETNSIHQFGKMKTSGFQLIVAASKAHQFNALGN